jgi:hypothetical protein
MDWPASIDTSREIDIETSRAPDAPVHRTTIWAVVEGGDVFIRSLKGDDGRWYRELTANPEAVVHVGDDAVPVRAVQAADAESVERASEGLRRKYSDSRSLQPMLEENILHTTVKLEPR